jgi:hypothetical protein
MSKVTIYFELEEILGVLKKNNHDVVDVLSLIRLFEALSAAQQVFPEHEERCQFYQDMVKKVFGEDYFK